MCGKSLPVTLGYVRGLGFHLRGISFLSNRAGAEGKGEIDGRWKT
jgi:hypothetical protein